MKLEWGAGGHIPGGVKRINDVIHLVMNVIIIDLSLSILRNNIDTYVIMSLLLGGATYMCYSRRLGGGS